MTRNIPISAGEFYHIYNRGTEKRNIFLSKMDYERFMSLLYLCNSTVPVLLKLQGRTLESAKNVKREKTIVDVAAFCLMPNHFHLILREKEKGGISRFIQKVITGYTMFFNKKYDRTGVLFQGKYKSSHVKDDEYLRYLISYLHLNPVILIESNWKERGIKDCDKVESYLKSYNYSSHIDYLKETNTEGVIVDKKCLPKYFNTTEEYRLEIIKLLNNPRSDLGLGVKKRGE